MVFFQVFHLQVCLIFYVILKHTSQELKGPQKLLSPCFQGEHPKNMLHEKLVHTPKLPHAC